MKKLLILIAIFSIALYADADSVDINKAKQIAIEFIQNGTSSKMRHSIARAKNSNPDQLLKHVQLPFNDKFYIFNIFDDDGYVIVSADDRTEAILGYSDHGNISADNIPENMAAMFTMYKNQIANLPSVMPRTSRQSSTAHEPVEPLMSTTWSQNSPYNKKTPIYASGNYVTGCVATAMAQIMKYWEWPKEACTTIPGYTTATNKITMSELPPYTFNWSDMRDEYKYTSDDSNPDLLAGEEAVSMLMLYCGQAVEMNYADKGSGSSTHKALESMQKYFGYSKNAMCLSAYDYSTDDFLSLIYNEISARRPVMISGISANKGHAFVCDGYDRDDYFHINWGWGGSNDGYFRLFVLNPYYEKAANVYAGGYNSYLTAIIGLQPKTEKDENISLIYNDSYINGITSRNNKNESFEVDYANIMFTDPSDDIRHFDVAFGFYDNEGNIQVLFTFNPEDTQDENDGNVISYKFDFSFGKGLLGRYELLPLYKLRNTNSEWNIAPVSTFKKTYLDITETTCTYIRLVSSDATVNSMSFENNIIYRDIPQALTIKIVNNNDIDSYNTYYIYIDNAEKSTETFSIGIRAHEYIDALAYITLPVGKHTIDLKYADKEGNKITAMSLTVDVCDYDEKNMRAEATIDYNKEDMKNGFLTSSQIKGIITIKNTGNTPYVSGLYQSLASNKNGRLSRNNRMLTLGIGDSIEIPFEYDIKECDNYYYYVSTNEFSESIDFCSLGDISIIDNMYLCGTDYEHYQSVPLKKISDGVFQAQVTSIYKDVFFADMPAENEQIPWQAVILYASDWYKHPDNNVYESFFSEGGHWNINNNEPYFITLDLNDLQVKFSGEERIIASGSCASDGSDRLTYTVNNWGVLNIEGHGTMISNEIPWDDNIIRTIKIGKDVDHIGDYILSTWNPTKLILDSENTHLSIIDGALYDSELTTLYYIPCGIGGEITIPETVTTIRPYCAIGNYEITKLTIPASVTQVGDLSFYNYRGSEIYSYITSPTDYDEAFGEDFNTNGTLYVPQGTLSLYKSTTGWKDIANIVESLPNNISTTTIANSSNKSIYDLQGRKLLSTPSRGIYIKDGKKYVK